MTMHLATLMKKFLAQHRALYCYLLLSVWLFLLLIVMYKYMETEDVTLTILKERTIDETTRRSSSSFHPDMKSQHILRACNFPQYIKTATEGLIKDNYQLEGLVILIRHGDRGPLTHVRDLSLIDCASTNFDLSAYEAHVDNMTLTSQLGQTLGQFHGFPLLPQHTCGLGQLTPAGVAQLLATGQALRVAYAERLGLGNSTNSEEIVAYSTKYRRTFQSALAFLYAFLTPDLLHNVVLKETPSLQFCFEDCACLAGDAYFKKFDSEKAHHLSLHPAVLKLMKAASSIVYEVYEKHQMRDPHSLKDALLAYVCHNAQLPCSKEHCMRTEQVTGLLSYIEWEAHQYSRSVTLKKASLLRAYGMVRNIVSHLVKMISERKPKIVLYSGHDKTIMYLATALGVTVDTVYLAPYASRFLIEVYRNVDNNSTNFNSGLGNNFYFRIVFNGKDMTNRIQFCKRSLTTVSSNGNGTPHVLFLCPIQNIIQFLHNDYFTILNASNFKDSCMIHLN